MKNILPIGSVVLLKNADKRVMVIGYYPTILEDEKEITYDYLACLFPEGVIDSNNSMMFNHEDADKIFYYGLIDEEQKYFMEELKHVVEEENTINDTKIEISIIQSNTTENDSEIETL